jgi:FKBP-type peptidyl-prolyl cis-trans isomerase FklB
MKTMCVVLAASVLGVAALATAQSPAPAASPAASQATSQFANAKDKVSYAIGADIANSFRRQGLEVNPDVLVKAFKEVYTGAPAQMNDQEIREAIMAFQQDMRTKMQEKMKIEGEQNKKDEVAFLAENAKKEGVVTLPSGLQYKVITMGTGPKPAATDTVTVHYRGTFLNGKEFDSSYSRKQPATFAVNRVVKGWTEALQLMPTGSKWQLVIPAKIGYGDAGNPPAVGPSACLIFEVELISIGEAGPKVTLPPAQPGQPGQVPPPPAQKSPAPQPQPK